MTYPTPPARENLTRPQPPTQESGRWRYTDQYGRTFLMGYSDAANAYNRDDRDVLVAQHDALVAAGARLGVLSERICTDYAPTRKLLCELDDARMNWDAALRAARAAGAPE